MKNYIRKAIEEIRRPFVPRQSHAELVEHLERESDRANEMHAAKILEELHTGIDHYLTGGPEYIFQYRGRLCKIVTVEPL